MNHDDLTTLIADSLHAHEHLAPNADAVLGRVQDDLDRPRRGRLAAVAATVLAVTGTSAAIALHDPHRAGPPRAEVGTRAPSSALVSLSTPSSPSTAATPIPPLTMPYDLGWLPSGDVHYDVRRINVGAAAGSHVPSFDGEYLLTVRSGARRLMVDVQQMPGTLRGVRFKSGPGRHVRIDGRRGVESRNASGPGGYEIYFVDSDGGVMYVNVAAESGQGGNPQALREIGRHVARQITFPGTAEVRPRFGIGRTPRGTQVVAFDVEDFRHSDIPAAPGPKLTTSYQIGRTGQQVPPIDAATGPNRARTGKPGRPVQQHKVRVSEDHGYRELEVLDAVRGGAVYVRGAVPWAQLYRIADGLVLP